MMPVIRIPDSVYERLQKHATPFVDSPATVIERLLDAFETDQPRGRRRTSEDAERDNTLPDTSYEPENPPDLRHTRILAAEIEGEQVTKWNDLVTVAHRHALARLGSFEAVEEVTSSNIIKGRKVVDGFHYHRDIGLSIQYVDANHSWKNAILLARRLGFPLQVRFQWRDKPGAAYPGQTGTLSWAPTKS